MTQFAASLDGGGTIEGSYRNVRADNLYELDTRWKDISSTYLIEHLKYSNVLTGISSGHVSYSMDRDDPSTLKGEGAFDVRNGQFSADFLLAQFEEQFENDMAALPPSLRFRRLSADVGLAGDRVRTPRLELDSEGLSIKGAGHFVRDGDMDYNLSVSISPDTAEKIPVLKDGFNIQGLRLAQQNIDLAFHVTGPTFGPQGELAELPPVGVTLVSGALELTSEAFRVIDAPRRILVDLLRTGTGVVAATK